MDKLTFKIINMVIEKKIDGNTCMELMCVQNSIIVNIVIPNSDMNNKKIIRTTALRHYDMFLRNRKREYISIGSIV